MYYLNDTVTTTITSFAQFTESSTFTLTVTYGAVN